MPSLTPPLAERLRPTHLDQLVGQQHLTSKGSVLRTSLERGKIPSMILWGPPGVGKTTIAHIIALTIRSPFYSLSAVAAGVKEVRAVIEEAQEKEKVVLFIDEIHRFNKGQQDALLGAVEKGTITLIGATTENPSFEINSALLSRCQVYSLLPLLEADLQSLLQYAIHTDPWLRQQNIILEETEALISISDGDARKLLNLLEWVVNSLLPNQINHATPLSITNEQVMQTAQKRVVVYDKAGEQHYDIISAFIKSIRGSDPNAALYWLARMITGGEDVKFIARRLVILSSEDIGNANPTALVMANACFDAVNKIGYPEARIILAQCVTYLASCAKSNASYTAIDHALKAVQEHGNLPVPLHLRNAPTALMKKMNYGKNYQYAHAFNDNFAIQEYLPEKLSGMTFYIPGNNAREIELRKFLKEKWKEKYGY
jgi:putative ATPase